MEVVTFAMSQSIRELIRQYQAFYEVLPYYVQIEERSPEGPARTQRLQAGFDIDIYGVKNGLEPGPLSDYAQAHAALQEVANTVTHDTTHCCSIEVISFASTVIIDTRRHFQPEGVIRIRISHTRGLDQPFGPTEETALKATLVQLHDLGISSGK